MDNNEELRKAEFEDKVASLSRLHAHILFWMMRGLDHNEIGRILHSQRVIDQEWDGDTVQRELTAIYEALDFPKDMAPKTKNAQLKKYAFPAIKTLTNDDPQELARFPLKQKAGNAPNRQSVDTARQWVDNNRQKVWFAIAGLLFLIFVVGAFLLGRGGINPPQPPPSPFPTLTQEVPVTETLAETAIITSTASPSETPPATLTATQTLTFTSLPADTQSPFGLQAGDELSDDRVTLALTKAEFDQGFDRIARKIAAISYWFDFTNHARQTILFRVDGSNFKVTDNLGIEYPCVFEDGVYITPELDKSVENGGTLQILLRCGPNQEFGDDVNEITLTVSGSRDLIESTWIVVP